MLDDLRQERLRQRDLVRCFYSENFCRGTSGDDSSIALASSELVDSLVQGVRALAILNK